MRERFSITGEQATTLAAGDPVDFDFTVRGPDFARHGNTESWSVTLVPPEVPSHDTVLEGKVRARLSDALDRIMAGDESLRAVAETLGRVLVSVVTARRVAETADLGVHVHNYGTDDNYGTDETNGSQG